MSRVTDFSDEFTRANSGDLGADYTPLVNSLQISGNAVFGGVAGDENVEVYTGVSLPADQFVRVTMGAMSINDELALLARSDGTTANLYFGVARDKAAGANGGRIAKNVASVFTTLANVTETWADNDDLSFEVIGNALTLLKNNVSILATTDGDLTSGIRAGMNLFCHTTVNNPIVKDWSIGHFSSAFQKLAGKRFALAGPGGLAS